MPPVKNVVSKPTQPSGLILEAWSEGFMVGALIIMAGITVSNMRRGVLLHKLILIELIFGIPQGIFIFTNPPVYGWFISVSAVFLNISWIMHNIIAWLKNKPFLSRKISYFYIGTIILALPFWFMEMYANFAYFNNINPRIYEKTRPYEALFRDPWWIFTTINLFWNIVRHYEFGILELIRVSPRFAILLVSMTFSVVFIIGDILSVTSVFKSSLPTGINPFWKLAFIFKCFTDTIILDDFKTALDRLKQYKRRCLGIPSSRSDESGTCTRPDLAHLKEGPDSQFWNESRGVTNSGESKCKEKERFSTTESEISRWVSGGVESSKTNSTIHWSQ